MILVLNHFENYEAVERHLAAHRAYLDTLYAEKLLIFSGRRKDARAGGLMLFNTDDASKVEAAMQRDPFIVHKASRCELIEFTANKYDPRFAPFAESLL